MAYGDFQDLANTFADKALNDKTFEIAHSPQYDGYQEDFLQWFTYFSKKNRKKVEQKAKLLRELRNN